jgi:hypothetical protein
MTEHMLIPAPNACATSAAARFVPCWDYQATGIGYDVEVHAGAQVCGRVRRLVPVMRAVDEWAR